jgi:oligoendopeptidase F
MLEIDPTKTTWNLTPLLSSDTDSSLETQKKAITEVNQAFVLKWKVWQDFLENPSVLKEALDEYEALMGTYSTFGNPGYYFWLRSAQDQSDPLIKGANNTLEEFSSQLSTEIQFFEHQIAKITPEKQVEFLAAPELQVYRHFLERLFTQAKHLLGDEAEKILTLKSLTSNYKWIELTETLLSKQEREIELADGSTAKKNLSELSALSSNANKKVRGQAATAFNEIMSRYSEVAEVELNALMTDKKTNDQLRGFSRPDASRHLHDDIQSETVDSMLEAVSTRFDISQSFYRFKAELLGVEKLAYHERNLEYGNVEGDYSYPKSINLVQQVFAELDPVFADIVTRFSNEGQVDVYPRQNKHGGAFCTAQLISQPVYILLNHTDRLHDVLTIAHEFGHAINDELIKTKQNALHFGTPLSTAEVASTFMEDFVLQKLLAGASDEQRLSLLMMKLDQDIATIFRQVACYRFEQALHTNFREKGYLSSAEIGKLFLENMEAYLGDAVELSEGSENWWVYWSHIRNHFYVYSYASGLLISKTLQHSTKHDPAFIEKVKIFLSSGLSTSHEDIFSAMGISITDPAFWQEGLQEVEALLIETKQLAQKLGKIKNPK